MSRYELIDYDRLLARIGIDNQQDWRCGDNPPDPWRYDEANLSYDDIYDTPDPALGQPFGAKYDGRASSMSGALCLTSDININGLLLNHRDINGTIWLCTEIEGWWTLPPSEIPDVPKPYWDGSMLTTGRYLTRTINISGCFIPPSKQLVAYNRDLLIRVASIVRGVGLLAMCGNANAPIDYTDPEYFDPFFDPSKMAIIQMNDVPLIETTKPNGFTQFSLSFKSVQPTKQSVGERVQTIPFPLGATGSSVHSYRLYDSFDSETADPTKTDYIELRATPEGPNTRKYSDVRLYNPTNVIADEEELTVEIPVDDEGLNLVNKGNYFAFPIFVFDPFVFNDTYLDEEGNPQPVLPQDRFLEITNTETGESLRVVEEIAGPTPESGGNPATLGFQLVVDTNARRVALVRKEDLDDPVQWDWNARRYLSLDSAWVSLASGTNRLAVSGPVSFLGNQPTAYWRDTWIG